MEHDWDIATTVHGPRRVVASPLPQRILDLDVIRTLVEQRAVVIAVEVEEFLSLNMNVTTQVFRRLSTRSPFLVTHGRFASRGAHHFHRCSCSLRISAKKSRRAPPFHGRESRISLGFWTIPPRQWGRKSKYDRRDKGITKHALDSLSTRRCPLCDERRCWNDIVPR